jgi:hypothetical protein
MSHFRTQSGLDFPWVKPKGDKGLEIKLVSYWINAQGQAAGARVV